MSARVILLATLAALALPSACADGTAVSALAADDECAAGDAACDLSLRQLRVHASAEPEALKSIVGEFETCDGSFVCEEGLQCAACGICVKKTSIVGEGAMCNGSLPPRYDTFCGEGLKCVFEIMMPGASGVCKQATAARVAVLDRREESAAKVEYEKETPWNCDQCENFAGSWKGQTDQGWVTSTQTQDGCVGKVTVAGYAGNVGLCGHHMTTDFSNGNQCEMMNDKTNLVCTDGTKWQKQSAYGSGGSAYAPSAYGSSTPAPSAYGSGGSSYGSDAYGSSTPAPSTHSQSSFFFR